MTKHRDLLRREFAKKADAARLQQFILDLNGDLAREYGAAIQYIQHAAVIDGVQWPTIEELNKHADEEIGHAKTLADKIDYLGGVPTIEVNLSKISEDGKEMLLQDIEGERDAIQRYRQRIDQAKAMKDYGSVEMLLEILSDEEEHENDLITFLGIKDSITAIDIKNENTGEDVQ